jgi:hypothetical protein
MFASAYAASPPFDKVKYGALNVSCDAGGVHAARAYGDSYLLLRRGVRLRATFAFYDTGSPEARKCLATCEHYAHVLAAYDDADLAAAMRRGGDDAAPGAPPARMGAQYKEVQVHGPLALGRHVEALVLAGRHGRDGSVRAAAEAFARKHGCNVIWGEE